MESTSNQSYSKGNDNNIFLILIIFIVAILWFTGFLNSRKENFKAIDRKSGVIGDIIGGGMDYGWSGGMDRRAGMDDEENLCCGGWGGTRSKLLCEPNAVVTRFTGRAAGMINNIGIECSDGRSVNAVGGLEGNSFNTHSPTGFNKLIVGTDRYVNSIRFFNENDQVGRRIGSGGGNQYTLNCDKGRIKGLDVNSSDLIDRIQVVCDESIP